MTFRCRLLLTAVLGSCIDHTFACTAMAVGCKATVDGSCLAASSGDGSPLDFRVIYVPAKDHPNGTMRPVYLQKQDYPRYVDAARAPGYAPVDGQKPVKPIGYIPEVVHTYAYWDAVYGVMNEHQLSMGETSCSGKLTAAPLGSPNGTALFEVGELNDIALERCKTARCAIQTMGDLAEQYGFYGTLAVKEAGEALTIADTEEVWVFHILPDDTGKSAVWAAQRVPDSEATVVPNVFVIRDIDLDDKDNFMYSTTMVPVAKKLGWWDGSSPFDFTHIYSPGEYNHPYYSGRRIWRALSLFAPSLQLDPSLGVSAHQKTYPFSVKPDSLLSPSSLFRIYRDHLEGTKFDLTKGVAGGPFQTPNRYAEGPNETAIKYGAWERAIGLYRTSNSFVAQSRKGAKSGGILHYGTGQQHANAYVPIFTSLVTDSPPSLSRGTVAEVRQESLWWAVTSLANLMDSKYSYMISDVREAQKLLEEELFPSFIGSIDSGAANVTQLNFDLISQARDTIWKTFWTCMAKYQNGYDNFGTTKVGYSSEWLNASGFGDFAASHAQWDQQMADVAKAQEDADTIFKSHHVGASMIV